MEFFKKFAENFSVSRFLDSLQYMWKGMLCIFIVIGVIILSTVMMNLVCNKAEEKKKLREAEKNQNS